jgi:tetratricopeptide (TPR) repeat protein
VDRFLEADKKSINSIFEALRVMRARAARSFILAKTVENREAVEAIEKLYDLIQQSSRAEERITWSRIIGLGRRVDHLHKLWILTGDSSALERAQGHLEKLEAILIKLTTLEEESITIASITPHQILAQRQFFEIDGANILSALALEKNDRAVMETAEAHMTSAVQLFEAATPQENYEIGSLIDHLGDLAPQKQSETIKIFFKQQLVLLRRARLDRDAELSAQSAGGFRRLAAAMKETCRGVDRGLAWYYSARAYESSFLWSSELDGNVGAAIRAYESALKDLRHEIAPIYFARTVLAYGQLHDRIGEYLKEKNLPIWQVHHEKAQDAQRAGSAILKSYLDVKE